MGPSGLSRDLTRYTDRPERVCLCAIAAYRPLQYRHPILPGNQLGRQRGETAASRARTSCSDLTARSRLTGYSDLLAAESESSEPLSALCSFTAASPAIRVGPQAAVGRCASVASGVGSAVL